MAVRKEETSGYARLRSEIKENRIGSLYIFYGEESWLRDRCLAQLKKQLVNQAFEEFSYRRFLGPQVDLDDLAAAIDSIPMMSERSLIELRDYDFWRAAEKQRERFAALLADVPDYCCLVLVFDQVEYRPDRRMKKLAEAVARCAVEVEFRTQEQGWLLKWIRRSFRELDRDIDVQNSEYLMFLCGNLTGTLRNEIAKIASYARETLVTREDIDAVATPTTEAVVFELTDALSEGNLDRSVQVLADLLNKKDGEPIRLLSIIGGTMRSLYLARLALDSGASETDLQKMLGYRSSYPARKLMRSASRLSAEQCMRQVRLCGEADYEMKQTGADKQGLLEQLLVRLCGRLQRG